MKRPLTLSLLGLLITSMPSAFAHSQDQASGAESLGDIARKVRERRAQSGNTPAKVYSNDNLPVGPAGMSVAGPAKSAGPGEQAPGRAASTEASSEKRDAAYYRKKMSELRAKLDKDQRELAVLQQKLNLNQMQYYPDPNQTLRQEFSRSDINKLRQQIVDKQKEVDSDQKDISDLDLQLRRDGGDAGWLQPGAAGAEHGGNSEAESDLQIPTDPKEAEQYWRRRFQSAREALANAQEEQHLAEDELSLLKIRQARELNNPGLGQQVSAKQAELESKRAATEKAQHALDDLERELAETGAPKEWSE